MKKGLSCVVGVIVALLFAFSSNADAGPVSWWKMDEGSWKGASGKVTDSSGSNHGAVYGEANTAAGGKAGRCGSFDGINGCIDCGRNASLDITDEITIEAWVCLDASVGAQYVVARNNVGDTYMQYGYYIAADREICAYAGSDSDRWSSGVYLPQSEWCHIVYVIKSGNYRKIYINGELKEETTCPKITSADLPLTIGARSDLTDGHKWFLNGLIDDVRIWDKALTSSQIKWHYNHPGQIIPEHQEV